MVKNQISKDIEDIIKYLKFKNKLYIKILWIIYMFILLVYIASFILKGYHYSISNIEFIRDLKNNNVYLTNFLYFIIVYLFLTILTPSLSKIINIGMYRLPKITFTIFTLLFIYMIYNTYYTKMFIALKKNFVN